MRRSMTNREGDGNARAPNEFFMFPWDTRPHKRSTRWMHVPSNCRAFFKLRKSLKIKIFRATQPLPARPSTERTQSGPLPTPWGRARVGGHVAQPFDRANPTDIDQSSRQTNPSQSRVGRGANRRGTPVDPRPWSKTPHPNPPPQVGRGPERFDRTNCRAFLELRRSPRIKTFRATQRRP